MTLWELWAFGEMPYGDLNGPQILAMLEKGQRLDPPRNTPPQIQQVSCHRMPPLSSFLQILPFSHLLGSAPVNFCIHHRFWPVSFVPYIPRTCILSSFSPFPAVVPFRR